MASPKHKPVKSGKDEKTEAQQKKQTKTLRETHDKKEEAKKKEDKKEEPKKKEDKTEAKERRYLGQLEEDEEEDELISLLAGFQQFCSRVVTELAKRNVDSVSFLHLPTKSASQKEPKSSFDENIPSPWVLTKFIYDSIVDDGVQVGNTDMFPNVLKVFHNYSERWAPRVRANFRFYQAKWRNPWTAALDIRRKVLDDLKTEKEGMERQRREVLYALEHPDEEIDRKLQRKLERHPEEGWTLEMELNSIESRLSEIEPEMLAIEEKIESLILEWNKLLIVEDWFLNACSEIIKTTAQVNCWEDEEFKRLFSSKFIKDQIAPILTGLSAWIPNSEKLNVIRQLQNAFQNIHLKMTWIDAEKKDAEKEEKQDEEKEEKNDSENGEPITPLEFLENILKIGERSSEDIQRISGYRLSSVPEEWEALQWCLEPLRELAEAYESAWEHEAMVTPPEGWSSEECERVLEPLVQSHKHLFSFAIGPKRVTQHSWKWTNERKDIKKRAIADLVDTFEEARSKRPEMEAEKVWTSRSFQIAWDLGYENDRTSAIDALVSEGFPTQESNVGLADAVEGAFREWKNSFWLSEILFRWKSIFGLDVTKKEARANARKWLHSSHLSSGEETTALRQRNGTKGHERKKMMASFEMKTQFDEEALREEVDEIAICKLALIRAIVAANGRGRVEPFELWQMTVLAQSPSSLQLFLHYLSAFLNAAIRHWQLKKTISEINDGKTTPGKSGKEEEEDDEDRRIDIVQAYLRRLDREISVSPANNKYLKRMLKDLREKIGSIMTPTRRANPFLSPPLLEIIQKTAGYLSDKDERAKQPQVLSWAEAKTLKNHLYDDVTEALGKANRDWNQVSFFQLSIFNETMGKQKGFVPFSEKELLKIQELLNSCLYYPRRLIHWLASASEETTKTGILDALRSGFLENPGWTANDVTSVTTKNPFDFSPEEWLQVFQRPLSESEQKSYPGLKALTKAQAEKVRKMFATREQEKRIAMEKVVNTAQDLANTTLRTSNAHIKEQEKDKTTKLAKFLAREHAEETRYRKEVLEKEKRLDKAAKERAKAREAKRKINRQRKRKSNAPASSNGKKIAKKTKGKKISKKPKHVDIFAEDADATETESDTEDEKEHEAKKEAIKESDGDDESEQETETESESESEQQTQKAEPEPESESESESEQETQKVKQKRSGGHRSKSKKTALKKTAPRKRRTTTAKRNTRRNRK